MGIYKHLLALASFLLAILRALTRFWALYFFLRASTGFSLLLRAFFEHLRDISALLRSSKKFYALFFFLLSFTCYNNFQVFSSLKTLIYLGLLISWCMILQVAYMNYIIQKVGNPRKVIPMIMPYHPLLKNVRPENYHKMNKPAAFAGSLLGISFDEVENQTVNIQSPRNKIVLFKRCAPKSPKKTSPW